MPLKKNFDPDKLNEFLMKHTIVQLDERIVDQLYYLGEMCVNEARQNGSYKDRTGNLRSSIGYGVFKDGQPIGTGGFEPLEGATDEGSQTGRNLLMKIGGEHTEGYVLVVVAGMNYGVYVEARGYNVLTSSELLAERELPGLLNDILDVG